MIENKHYLHQMFTEVFLEFEDKQELKRCRNLLDKTCKYWNYDPVAEIDTSDKAHIKKWINFMLK